MPQNPAVRIIAFAALLLAVAIVVLAYTPWGQSLWQGKVAQHPFRIWRGWRWCGFLR